MMILLVENTMSYFYKHILLVICALMCLCCNDASHQETPPSILDPAAPRIKSKKELSEEIEAQWKHGIYIRKIVRYEDEIKYVIDKRVDLEKGTIKPDDVEPYWVSASIVREGLHIPLYNSTGKTGLVISNKAELGYFSPHDAAAPTKARKNTVNLRPPPSPLTQDMFQPGQVAYAQNLFKIDEVLKLLQDMVSGAAPIPKLATGPLFAPIVASGDPVYNEAIIFYKLSDILGIWADQSDNSDAIAFQAAILTKYGIELPLVEYDWQKINPAIALYAANNFTVNFSVK